MIKNINYNFKRIQKICENNDDMSYKMLKVPKKNGKYRIVNIPNNDLKNIQRTILTNILEHIEVSSNSTAFVKGKSIKDNAIKHVNKKYILNLDLDNFFDNIKYNQVYSVFKNEGYTDFNANKLTKLCTYKGRLPQGAPTSPYLSNIICRELDKQINCLCKEINADYTRYADDITISSNNKNLKEHFNNIVSMITNQGFKINTSKTRYVTTSKRQLVTGVVVNEKLNICNEEKKEIRQILYYCKKYGIANHIKNTNMDITEQEFRMKLKGKIAFINSINPKLGKIYMYEYSNIN